MRIEGNGGAQVGADLGAGQRADSGPPAVAASEREDQATISARQAKVQTLVGVVNGAPEVRQEKVLALAAAVRNGSYRVAPEKTASAILEQMRRA